MYLRVKRRFKDGKEHRYWSIVESRRVHGKRVVQRQVLYLGEINDSQQAAWCKTIGCISDIDGHSSALPHRKGYDIVGHRDWLFIRLS